MALKNRSLCRYCIPLLVVISLSGCRQEAEFYDATDMPWPQWRGPNRDGVSLETDLFGGSSTVAPKVVWRTQIGSGFSALSLAHGRLYTMFAERRSEFLGCFSVSTGEEIWRLWIDDKFINSNGDGPRATPTIDGDLIFALSGKGKLQAVDARSQKKLWEHNLNEDFGGRELAVEPWRGYASSPLVEGELLLVEVGGAQEGSSLVAFDKNDGRILWTSYTTPPGYASPIAITVHGRRQVIFFPAQGLVSIDPEDGSLNWEYGWRTDYDINAATPIFMPPDKIFISSGYDRGAAVLKIMPDDQSVDEIWKSRVMRNHFSTSVFYAGHLYGFDNANLKCIRASDGVELWKVRGLGKGSLIIADDHLIILGEKGKLVIAEANPNTFTEKGSLQVFRGKCWTMPSLANGRLYLRGQHEMVCLDLNQEAG